MNGQSACRLPHMLAGTTPPDDAFAKSISEAMSMVTSEESDPWADV